MSCFLSELIYVGKKESLILSFGNQILILATHAYFNTFIFSFHYAHSKGYIWSFNQSQLDYCRGHLLGSSFLSSGSARGPLQDEDHHGSHPHSFPPLCHMRSGTSPEWFRSGSDLVVSWECLQNVITSLVCGFPSYYTPETTSLWLLPQFPRKLEL